MKAIVVADRKWSIGRDGGLLVHLPGDLRYFKEKTLGKVIIMGRRTLESLPGGRPLPGRTTIVLSGNPDYQAPEGVILVRSAEELHQKLAEMNGVDAFLCGGEQVYRRFLSECDGAFVTKLDAEFPADKTFPNLDELDEWALIWTGGEQIENEIFYRFTEYVKKVEQ